MMKVLSKSAKTVQDALSKKGLSFEVIELSSSTRTAHDAAATIGCEVAQIIKSLLFRSGKTNQPVLILASGVNRVNEKTIEILIVAQQACVNTLLKVPTRILHPRNNWVCNWRCSTSRSQAKNTSNFS